MEEQELIRRAQEGDADAFSMLVRTHRNPLIQVAYGFLHDREEAMDAAQEVFFKAYRKIHSFKNQSSLYTWLYRIMINHCKDRLRSRKRTSAVSIDSWNDDGLIFEIPDQSSNPAQMADQRERERIVKAAIEILPDKHKKVLLLRELGGLSYKEISQVLNCREGTVMSRLYHARRMLAGELSTLIEELV
ncbi:MAG: sigma-70 family RNA polymerase sigma factor [Candidatus Omnitrophica bacterium]|nr:sigma-70 family RNA polymerase sigma factor [Candidatus Omnitrophota bacterium]